MTSRSDSNATPGVLLAGGLARRIGGGDKPLRAVGGRSILERAVATLAPQCSLLMLNVNGDAARFAAFHLPVIADSLPGFAGPLAGILAGLDRVAANDASAQWMLSAPADCPFLPDDLVMRLHAARAAADVPIAIASSGGRFHHVVALWSVALRDDLRHALTAEDVRQVSRFIARHPFAVADWALAPHDPFFNVNTEADLEEAERIAGAVQNSHRRRSAKR